MITVVAIFIVLMQVNIVQAGTAIKYAIVDDKAFKVQNTKGFTSIDWNAINRNFYSRVFLRHAAVPLIARRRRQMCITASVLSLAGSGLLVNALHHQRLSDIGEATTLNDNTVEVRPAFHH